MDLTQVTVTIGNKSFITTKNSLLSSGLFRSMMEIEPDSTNFIMNDRSKKVFKHILSYLQDKQYPFPRKYKYELDFYDIDYDEKNLYNCHEMTITKLNDICNNQMKLLAETDEIKSQFKDELDLINNKLKDISKNIEGGTFDDTIIGSQCRLCSDERLADYAYCRDHICKNGECPHPAVQGETYCRICIRN